MFQYSDFYSICKLCMPQKHQTPLLSSFDKHFFSFNKKKLFTCFEKYIQSTTHYLIAVSWWSDSMFLSYALFQYFMLKKYPLDHLCFLYCDHKVRKNTWDDIAFLSTYFSWMNFLVSSRSSWGKHTEESLRNRRYEEILRVAKQNNCSYVVFWHNLTDRIESTFLNLLRWSHLSGFLSMQVFSSHHLLPWLQVFRPLLTLEKAAIRQHCKEFAIPYREDSTNTNPAVSLRNRLRLTLLPSLYALSHKHTLTTNTFCESMQKVYEACESFSSSFDPLSLQSLSTSPYWKARFAWRRSVHPSLVNKDMLAGLFQYLGLYSDLTSSFLNEVLSFLHRSSSWHMYVRWVYLFLAHNTIYIISAPKDFWKKTIDKQRIIPSIWDVPLGKEKVSLSDSSLVWLLLRYPKSWDIYKWKTWTKYCINKKIPLFWRTFVPVVVRDGRIVAFFYSW